MKFSKHVKKPIFTASNDIFSEDKYHLVILDSLELGPFEFLEASPCTIVRQ